MKPILTTLRVTTPPLTEPVTLTNAKLYSRIYVDYEDSLVADLITTARMMAENYLSRSLITQTLDWTMKPMHTPHVQFMGYWNYGFWGGLHPTQHLTLELPRAPVQSVTTVTLIDFNGAAITLTNPPCYTLDTNFEPARLCIYWDQVGQLSTVPVYPLQHIEVVFVAGYADATTIPRPIVQAIMLLVNHLYENRGDTTEPETMPKVAYALLDPYRIVHWGSGV